LAGILRGILSNLLMDYWHLCIKIYFSEWQSGQNWW